MCGKYVIRHTSIRMLLTFGLAINFKRHCKTKATLSIVYITSVCDVQYRK